MPAESVTLSDRTRVDEQQMSVLTEILWNPFEWSIADRLHFAIPSVKCRSCYTIHSSSQFWGRGSSMSKWLVTVAHYTLTYTHERARLEATHPGSTHGLLGARNRNILLLKPWHVPTIERNKYVDSRLLVLQVCSIHIHLLV